MTTTTFPLEDEKGLLINYPFPIEVFPLPIQDIIEQYCKNLNLNIDYSAATVLFAFSVAMGSHYSLKVKNGWVEMPTLFMALVGKAGINKSAPISIFTQPLEHIDKRLFDNFLQQYKEYKTIVKESKEVKEEPIRKQLILNDTTQEATLKGLYENKHGFGGIYDELGSFLRSFNKYKNGGGDEELMLSLFSGKRISVNRKSSTPFIIERPFLSIIGSIQPLVLVNLMGGNRVDNGLTHRFLFAYPDNVKREQLSENDVPEDISGIYQMLIEHILTPQMLEGECLNKKLSLTKEAFEFYKTFRSRINDVINNEKSEAISGIYAKLDIYFIRISLIVHVMRIACHEACVSPYEVEASSLEKAEKIINYFEHTAVKVFRLLERHRDPLAEYPMEHKILYYQLPLQFATNQGWEIAKEKVSRRTFFNILSDDYLFTKLKHGIYEKVW